MTTVKAQFSSRGHAQASSAAQRSAQHDLGSPEASGSRDLMDWAQVSCIMMQEEKNLIFHSPFLNKKYAVGVPLWLFSQREDCCWSPRPPGAPALRVSNFNFEPGLLGLCWDWGSGGPSLNKATGLFIVSPASWPHGLPSRSYPILSASCPEEPPAQPGPAP